MVTVIKKGSDKNNIRKALASIVVQSGIDAYKYCGKVKLKADPLIIQKNLRDEWE